ncbi:MAG TPA: hypothetical protein VMH02_11570, partial [Verrucomicrobiae bacterium]|nr:hypothetical protein [Verrucomicrobiae bacterium]
MIENERYRFLTERLAAEYAALRELRASYATVTRSRFHALRMLWFSLKQLLLGVDAGDVYAVWSPSLIQGAGPSAV